MKCTKFLSIVLILIQLSIAHCLFGQAGMLDLTFGDSGLVATNTGVRYFSAESMVLQPDGKIVVGFFKLSKEIGI